VNSREPQYRNQLIEAFNSGYRDEEARYETCDRTATQAEAELRAQGLRIADALRARHTE
jgi:predicted secreted protein